MASALVTGSAPGSPRQTGQVCVLGGAPNSSGQPQNILVLVWSWTWISRPMTVSNSVDSVIAVIVLGPPGRAVEADRPLQRVGGAQDAVLAERGPGDLEADRQPVAQPVGDRDRGDAR